METQTTPRATPEMGEGECTDRVYANAGNGALLARVPPRVERLLDVGCGAGDNARILLGQRLGLRIHGLTLSEEERVEAGRHMEACWVTDIETDALPALVSDTTYDVILLSHVLEHLRHPAQVVARLAARLSPGGRMIIAVPNVLVWRQRVKFIVGRFEYEETGVMDRTHLHFYTFDTADAYLLSAAPSLRLVEKAVEGDIPLWFLRRHVLPSDVRSRLDRWGTSRWPNLFGGQVLIVAERRAA